MQHYFWGSTNTAHRFNGAPLFFRRHCRRGSSFGRLDLQHKYQNREGSDLPNETFGSGPGPKQQNKTADKCLVNIKNLPDFGFVSVRSGTLLATGTRPPHTAAGNLVGRLCS